jgi:hypothetical protein
MEEEQALREQPRNWRPAQTSKPKRDVLVRSRRLTPRTERDRIRREWELMEIARWERRVASTAERRKLWKNAAHGCATHEELDQLFPSRYGRV